MRGSLQTPGPPRRGTGKKDLLAYVGLAATTTVTDMLGRDRAHLASKLTLAPMLAATVLATRSERSPGRTATLVGALAGSTVGDLYMYRSSRSGGDRQRVNMRRGAGAFGVQQAGLISLLLDDGARPRPVPSVVAATTLAVLAVLDSDGEGTLDPVLTGYGLLLGSMSALAMGAGDSSPRGRALALGGSLFLISDAAIIVGQQFATTPRTHAVTAAVVLPTYAAALALLVHGLRRGPSLRG